jgi:fatty acid-binding protein DegV
MRFGLLVDASCDLPASQLENSAVRVLPIHCRANEKSWQDDRSALVREEFVSYADSISWQGDIETQPLNTDETRAFVLDRLAKDFDYVFAVTAMRSRSVIFDTLTDVAIRMQPHAAKVRADAEIKGPFRLHVCDSSTLFSGHAAIALSLLDELQKQTVTTQIARMIDTVYSKQAFTYFVPAGLSQLYNRAKARGDKSLNFVSYALGSALDIKPIVCGAKGTTAPVAKVRHFEEAANRVFKNARRQVMRGLISPHVVVSVGGSRDDIFALLEFQALRAACETQDVQLHVVPMGIGALVNAGTGGVAVGFLGQDHTFEE